MNELNERNGNTIAAEPEVYPLDESFIGILTEFRQAAQGIEAQAQGALLLYMRQHGLQGRWQVAPNGKELVRAAA